MGQTAMKGVKGVSSPPSVRPEREIIVQVEVSESLRGISRRSWRTRTVARWRAGAWCFPGWPSS